ncbi:MAG TPA: hypothetical protein VJ773_00980 [Gemmatimonadales bacterium]|nr:hypothetical protein [Gemmatimonadales bacterium]
MSPIRSAALLAALALIPAAAQAQTITACYVPKTGSVYRIQAAGAPDTCKTNHVEFSWNAGGGSTGAVSTVTETHVVPAGAFGFKSADCPTGSTVVGGGFLVPGTGFAASSSRRNPLGGGWVVTGYNTGAEAITLYVEAYCSTSQ